MTSERENLKEALQRYVSETYADIDTIRVFSKGCDQWIQARVADIQALAKIEESGKMGAVLEKTLSGLKDLQHPLEAMERLVVTSFQVFQKNLNPEMDLEAVRLLIHTAQSVAPLLILFKQDNDKFFHPNALNKDVFQDKLQRYIVLVRSMFDGWENAALNNFNPVQPKVNLQDLSEEDILKMLSQIRTLSDLRADQAFMMVVLFHGRSQHFRETFCELKPQMEQLRRELEGCAEQLDSINKGCRISDVVSSTEGITAGILAVTGLVLAPCSLGLSLIFDLAGLGLGLVSGVQALVTRGVENSYNNTQTEKARKALNQCVALMNEAQFFLNNVIQDHFEGLQKILLNKENMATLSADAKYHVTEGESVISRVRINTKNLENFHSITAILLIVVSVIVEGISLFYDVHSLNEGTETELSQMIRAKTPLWGSQIESWQKVYDSLCEGEKDFERKQEMLKEAFYPQI